MGQENRTGVRTFTAGAALAVYLRVKLNASQQAVVAGVDEPGIGTVDEAAASGDPVSVRLHSNPGTRKVVCAGAVSAGAQLHGAAGGKVDDATTGGPVLYEALEAGSGNGSIIEAIPVHTATGGSGLLYANLADSATEGVSSSTEFTFDKSYTFPAGDLKEGDVLDIEAVGVAPATNATDTLYAKLFVGTEEIADTGALDVANGDIFRIKARVTVTASGAGGAVRGSGTVAIGVPATVTDKPFSKASAAEDLSGAILIAIRGKYSVANAGNSAVLRHLTIVRHRK